MQPLKSRIEAIQKVKPPKTVKLADLLWNSKLYVSILTKFARKIDPYILYN